MAILIKNKKKNKVKWRLNEQLYWQPSGLNCANAVHSLVSAKNFMGDMDQNNQFQAQYCAITLT